nr:hypothetical protein [Tanacetum cinerariifolium]
MFFVFFLLLLSSKEQGKIRDQDCGIQSTWTRVLLIWSKVFRELGRGRLLQDRHLEATKTITHFHAAGHLLTIKLRHSSSHTRKLKLRPQFKKLRNQKMIRQQPNEEEDRKLSIHDLAWLNKIHKHIKRMHLRSVPGDFKCGSVVCVYFIYKELEVDILEGHPMRHSWNTPIWENVRANFHTVKQCQPVGTCSLLVYEHVSVS